MHIEFCDERNKGKENREREREREIEKRRRIKLGRVPILQTTQTTIITKYSSEVNSDRCYFFRC